MKYQNKEKMKEAFLHDKLSLPLAMHVIAKFKKELISVGISSFPTICLIGRPGTGKTPAARAILKGENSLEITYQDKSTLARAKLDENREKIVLLDDYANLTSNGGKEAQKRIFDYAIRRSYDGMGALVITTMEVDALKYLAESAVLRMVPIIWGDGLGDTILSNIVSYLQAESDMEVFMKELDKVEVEFEPLVGELISFRRYHAVGEYIPKRPDMIFLYHWAMNIINAVWNKEFGEFLFGEWELHELEEKYMHADCNAESYCKEFLSERVLEYAIKDGFFVPTCPAPNYTCKAYLNGKCENMIDFWAKGCSGCRWEEEEEKNVYRPLDLILQQNENENSVLISDTKFVPYYNRPYDMPPCLIVLATYFEDIMNKALQKMSMETKEQAEYFTSERLRKELFDINRIAAIPNGNNGYRYTIMYPGLKERKVDKVNCVMILLRPDEVEVLFRHSNGLAREEDYSRTFADYSESIKILKKAFSQPVFHTKTVPIGGGVVRK